jgi:hypothetical protein
LKNISLHLPEGYELITGTKLKDIHLYYDTIQTAIIRDPYHFKIILNVPLKQANLHFILYKILALPIQISNGTFAQYLPEFLYFGTDHVQRSYILFTEAEFSYCTQSNIAICPANKAIFSRQVLTCEASLFFQTTDNLRLCSRKLLLHHTTPLLKRYDSTWIFHFPKYQHIILRCWKNGTWVSTTKRLQGNGTIRNSSACLLTADEFQALPRMSGISLTAIDTTRLYVPDRVAVIASHELQTLKESIPPEVAQLDYIEKQVAIPHQELDVDSFRSTTRTQYRHDRHTFQYLTTLTALCTVIIIATAVYLLKTYWYNITSRCFAQQRTPDPPVSSPANDTPSTSYDPEAHNSDEPKKNVTFSLYSLQSDT